MKQYLFVTITILLILLFYLGLPDLDHISSSASFSAASGRKRGRAGAGAGKSAAQNASPALLSEKKEQKLQKADFLIPAVLVLVFGIVDFIGLGNTSSPETFSSMGGKTAVFSLEGEAPVNSIALFTGVGPGDCEFSGSSASESTAPAAFFHQDYGEVLRWIRVIPDLPIDSRSISLSGTGDFYLGEVIFLDENNSIIPCSCSDPLLCDEQEKLQLSQSFMNSTYFDEIYHARTAWEHINAVYPYEISHPPLGKLIISLGIAIFGMTPFGWRFSGTFFGVLMLPVIYIFSRKLFGSKRISACCAILAGTEFMHFVQTRISTIDTYAVFFILLMYLFMYEYIETGSLKKLALCGISFGLGAACKWTCFYAGAGLAVIWAADRFRKREEGFRAFLRNSAFCMIFFVFIPSVIYYAAYIPYGIAEKVPLLFSRDYFRIVAENQKFMFSYHSNLVAEHPYSSVWYEWLLDIKPILYYLDYLPDGTRSEFGAFTNPLLTWAGLISILLLAFCGVIRKDRKARFLLAAYFAQLIPWIFVTRLTFEYHYFPCIMFLTLAIGYIFELMKDGESKHWKLYAYTFTGFSCILFAMFYPALSGRPVHADYAMTFLKWLPSWPF